MFFKNVTCLTKVTDNQTKTTRTDECIYFNDSTVELKGKDILLDIKDREVVFIASSVKEREIPNGATKPIINVILNWVKCVKNETVDITLSNNVSDILIVTREIYDELKIQGKSEEDIYILFKKNGLGQMSLELTGVKDFSALTANIVKEEN